MLTAVNLSHLAIFRAIAEQGSVTKAAEKLMVSQPAVSKQLKDFERELGVALFERHPKGVRPTEAGAILADYAGRIFNLTKEAVAALKDMHGLRRGRLTLGASPTVGVYFLPALLVHFRRRFPGIQLHLEIAETELLTKRMEENAIDMMFAPVQRRSPVLEYLPFMTDEFIAIASPDHPLASRRSIRPEALATAAFVARESPSATGALVENFFFTKKIPFRPTLTLSSIEAVKQAVVAGLGISIVSRMAVGAELSSKRLVRLNVKALKIQRSLFRAHLRSRIESKAAIAFACLLKHAVRGILPKFKTASIGTGGNEIA